MITLHRARPFGYVIAADDGRDILVQVDTDYPGVASSFGWSVARVPDGAFLSGRSMRYVDVPDCAHDGTDGTITCESCGASAASFIASAADWLDAHDGATADDPGYFAED